jgi:Protein of unknown function (DUF4236)/Bacterial SH3 domain
MGWRFRNSVKIAPGIRLNFSKSGISTSLGGSGATVNIGSKGTRSTLGIPGSGVSYSTLHSPGQGGIEEGPTTASRSRSGCWSVVGVIALLLAISRCGTSGSPETSHNAEPATSPSTVLVAPEIAYVSASSLNARTNPSTNSPIVQKLARGDQLTVVEREGDWAKVVKSGVTMWIAAKYLSDSFIAVPRKLEPAKLMSPKSATKGSRMRNSGGGVCPCSSGHVCVGPRGGRYCITSGGNKRYGV